MRRNQILKAAPLHRRKKRKLPSPNFDTELRIPNEVQSMATVQVDKTPPDVVKTDTNRTGTTCAGRSASKTSEEDIETDITTQTRRPPRVSCKAKVEQTLLEDKEHIRKFEAKYGKINPHPDGLVDLDQLFVNRERHLKSEPRKISLAQLLKPLN